MINPDPETVRLLSGAWKGQAAFLAGGSMKIPEILWLGMPCYRHIKLHMHPVFSRNSSAAC